MSRLTDLPDSVATDTESSMRRYDFSQGKIVKEVDEAYKAGAEEAWRCAQRISMMHIKDMVDADLMSWIEDVDPWKASCILISMISADEAIFKIQNWKKKLQKEKRSE